MGKYIAKRLVLLIFTLMGVMIILFGMIYLIPGDPAVIMLHQRVNPESKALIIHRLGLDQPMLIRFGRYFWGVLHGDFGVYVMTNRAVLPELLRVLPYTLGLATFAMGISIIIGVTLGILAAFYKDTLFDHIVTVLSTAAVSMVDYVAALILLLIFAVKLDWFPSLGIGERGNIIDQLYHLILPAFALAISWVGYIERLVRESLGEVLSSDYIKTARLFGIPKSSIVYKYALRNAAKAVVTVVGVGWGVMLGGAVFIEIIFNRLGLGKSIIQALYSREYFAAQGGILVIVILFVGVVIITDIICAYIDPRIRLG